MACPSNYPIDTNTDCIETTCSTTACMIDGARVYGNVVKQYYDRCKNSDGVTICNYVRTETGACTCLLAGGS